MEPILTTERLVLRPLRNDDAAEFSRLANDMDIARMTGSFPHPMPELSAEFRIIHLNALKRQGKAHPYVITRRSDDQFMGSVDLFQPAGHELFEIGYWLGKPYWGKGFAREAVRAVLLEGRESLDLSEIQAGVFVDNSASLRLLKKLGFDVVGADDDYFSMARLVKAKSHLLRLDTSKLTASEK